MLWLFLWDNIKHCGYKKEHYLCLCCFYGTTLGTVDARRNTTYALTVFMGQH